MKESEDTFTMTFKLEGKRIVTVRWINGPPYLRASYKKKPAKGSRHASTRNKRTST